ncbi:MAG: type II secretion system F family protein [Candidatus Thioglobus sp.]|nr:MAG: type II secretion system F family protein [Candidatus Thioglobus sp.]|tara:strand:+ start:387 stop:1607 length:1221 start_codon:yes stop_codon:yes gene_type:complete
MSNSATQLRHFSWQGLDKRGMQVSGESHAASALLLKADLRRQGIQTTKVKKKSRSIFSPRAQKISAKEIALFARQLATMMSAGVPLVQAFEIIAQGNDNPTMRDLLLSIKKDIESGNSLYDALHQQKKYFDELFCNLVAAGEQSGTLETLLDKIATYKEKTEALKAKVKKALFYPTAVLLVAFIVCAILLIFVVPQFEEIFRSFGADLPVFTRIVISLSEFMQLYWWAILAAIGLSCLSFLELKKRSFRLRKQLDTFALKITIVGTILEKSAIARFSRTLSTMFAAGVPLVEAMDSVAGASGNILFQEATLKIKDEVASGSQLFQSMKQSHLFPNMVVQMVAIGEESGSLDEMLAKVADFYEDDVNNLVEGLSSLLEPLIMAVLGVIVGGLVIAMYLPIFQMGSVV